MTAEEFTRKGDWIAIAILYDSLLSGSRAMEVYQSLRESLPKDCRLDLKISAIEELNAASEEQIEEFLREPQLILLALDKDRPVPAEVRAWIGDHARIPGEEAALGLMLTGRGPGKYVHQNKHEIKELAASANFDFISSDPSFPLLQTYNVHEPEESTGYIYVERVSEGWGLND